MWTQLAALVDHLRHQFTVTGHGPWVGKRPWGRKLEWGVILPAPLLPHLRSVWPLRYKLQSLNLRSCISFPHFKGPETNMFWVGASPSCHLAGRPVWFSPWQSLEIWPISELCTGELTALWFSEAAWRIKRPQTPNVCSPSVLGTYPVFSQQSSSHCAFSEQCSLAWEMEKDIVPALEDLAIAFRNKESF